ncbi:uncharacterized protein HMPREF1541_05098 [Cyphellophora europaea CBS 101466]|uniref:Cohesin loading factor n=1 Tax=Cyphellophora europaea (strain CBS 101466) TaxID=1220924 RepID=W2RYF0_CYPE1|nr:uncharacterized protein HMPREF1541_05098 [Cyphellophora europaea CBS 101466]ETN40818.1 hypothetical protein HMPREF1541_05098 [Cyphellophora europaea CBS 101466]
MDGYNNKWSGYGFATNDETDYLQQLQQHARQQPQVFQYSQSYQQQQYYPPQSQPAAYPQIEVVVPSRPPQMQYQPSNSQPSYYHNQQYAPQPVQYHQMYQQPPQFDGTMNGYPALAVQPPQRPLHNGVPKQESPTMAPAPVPPPATSTPPPQHDYARILLVLADEYIQAANRAGEDSEEHFRLVSFALGCMESALNNFQLSPLREAQVSLTYAQILYEETENYDEAEKVLTKAVELCERNNYLDLKYSLMLLSVRVLFQTKPKAAVKAIQGYLADMEAYKHTAWEYAFRYELAILNLSPNLRDIQSAIFQLGRLESLADKHHDKAMVAFAAAMLGLLLLQTCQADAISDAQQAIARLRSMQFDPQVAALPQLRMLAEYVDLCCSIRQCNHQQGDEKRKRMQDTWGRIVNDAAWRDGGNVVYIPLNDNSLHEYALQSGGLVVKRDGKYVLPFSWCNRDEFEAVAFLLCASSKAHKNSSDGGKAQQFLDEGLARIRDATGATVLNRQMLECRFLIDSAYLQCLKSQWTHAKKLVTEAASTMKGHEDHYPKSMISALQYLNGTIHQGLGNLERALQIWQSPIFDLKNFLQRPIPNQPRILRRHQDLDTEVRRNLCILACMNRLFIIDDGSHPRHREKADLLVVLDTFVKSSQDRNISAAHTLVHSLLTNSGIWVSKEALVKALGVAKEIMNQQITALVLVVMQQAFFLGATDAHAQKCVNAVAVQMKSWRSPTWMHVTEGIQAESLQFMGQFDESAQKLEAARCSWEKLPEGIRKSVDWRMMPKVKTVAKQQHDAV